MADIEIRNNNGRHAPATGFKKNIRVDLTPMVDLGFLLLTFFVFTTTMAKPTVMDMITPCNAPPGDPVCNSCALTVLLDKDDVVYYYAGAFVTGVLKKSDFNSIRNVILQQKNALQQTGRDKNQFSLIIKSSDAARFRNFVDITDEVTINRVPKYYIDELTTAERAEMQGK